jgi:mercuric ion transport protein
MNHKTLLRTGLIGTAVAALCCFTPLLVVLVSAVGLSAVIGYLDYVLLPALAVFLGVTAYAFYLRSKGERTP